MRKTDESTASSDWEGTAVVKINGADDSERKKGHGPNTTQEESWARYILSCHFLSASAALLSLVTLVIQNSSLVLMTRYSRFSVPVDKSYHTSSLVLNQEILKMFLCLVIFAYERKVTSLREFCSLLSSVCFHSDVWKLAIPAALFTLQNFLLFVALAHLDAMTFQVVSQTKLLTAAVFSVWLLDRRLHKYQWLSLCVLTIGVLFAQAEGQKEKGAHHTAQYPLLGAIACFVSGLSSSFAGVYFEKVVKTTAPSLAIRNIHLSMFGIPFAFLSMIAIDLIPSRGAGFNYWRGYNTLTWCLVVIHALGGLLVAVVVKYADNILKGFATGVAIILSGIFATMFWGYIPSTSFVLGSCLVVGSSVLYHYVDVRFS